MRYFKSEKKNNLALELRSYAERKAIVEKTVYWKILRNKAISSICTKLPRTTEEFLSKGVLLGNSKVKKYGDEILKIIEKYCVANNIDTTNKSLYIQQAKVMVFKKAGLFYNVFGNDALILHKYLGYKLYGSKTIRTGFPVSAVLSVLKKIDKLSIDYDLLNQDGVVISSKRFDNNRYEIVNQNFVCIDKEKFDTYVAVLRGLAEGVDITTGEVVEGLSVKVKLQLIEMSDYFEFKINK